MTDAQGEVDRASSDRAQDKWLLVSDVDNTVVAEGPDDHGAAERLAAHLGAERSRLTVVYNSGRFVSSILQTVTEHGLATPDVCVGGVGTEVRVCQGERVSLPAQEVLHGWPESSIDRWDAKQARQAVLRWTDAELQPAEFQSPYKVSFYLRDASAGQVKELEGRLESLGVDASLIYSSDRDLDVLPRGLDKAAAAAFVARALGFPNDRVVVAGDSGNDRAMLNAGFLSVVVANAKPELADLTGPRVFRSDACYGDGVVQGLRHWMSAGRTAAQPGV
ncbi:MAG: HAD-IIB family hydrolase [Planctomycetota bacterium]